VICHRQKDCDGAVKAEIFTNGIPKKDLVGRGKTYNVNPVINHADPVLGYS
jgi:hypothetical protein